MGGLNSALRRIPGWAIYGTGAIPFLWLAAGVVQNSLGPDPAKVVERSLGEWAMRFLLLTLAITPLRQMGLNLLKHRRAIGLLSFFYAVLHLGVWLWPDMGLRWAQIWQEVMKRPYILLGLLAFLCMAPLAATSSNAAIRRMGAASWRRLHLLTYPAAALGLLHYITLSRVWTFELLFYLGLAIFLLAWRGVIPSPIPARRRH